MTFFSIINVNLTPIKNKTNINRNRAAKQVEAVRVSALTLVDLAGSERVSKARFFWLLVFL